MLATPLAEVFTVNEPLFDAELQFKALTAPTGKSTVLVNEHVLPPIFIAKLAVPLDAGVPVIVYTTFPFPEAKVPEVRVAVRPETPVDVIV